MLKIKQSENGYWIKDGCLYNNSELLGGEDE